MSAAASVRVARCGAARARPIAPVALCLCLWMATAASDAAPPAMPVSPADCPASPAAQPPRTELPTDEQLAARAGAWDRSVELERAGRLDRARAGLLHAWGPCPSGYEVSVRLAWLSLLLEEPTLAVAGYRRARRLAGAGPEATRGLGTALTLSGYAHWQQGDRRRARSSWREALRLDPARADARRGLALARPHRIDPEIWLAFIGQSGAGAQSYGGSASLHLPARLTDWLTLRGVYRHVELLETSGGGAGSGRAFGGPRSRFHQDDGYVALGVDSALLRVEAMALALSPSSEGLALGEGVALRVGRRYGALVEQAAISREAGWNLQLAPMAFVWPGDWLGIAAGARLTFDHLGEQASAIVGLSVLTEVAELHARAHMGVERWPVDLAVPSVLTADDDLTLGGSIVAVLPVSSTVTLSLQGEVQRLDADSGAGIYGSGAVGLRFSP